MRITADTNLFLRDALQDDPGQTRVARQALDEAELVAVPVSVLCEFVWVLRRGYNKKNSEVAEAIRLILNSANVAMDRSAVEAGLATLESGGDFADGAIDYEGRCLGAEEFVSFDKQAVSLLKSQGTRARLLS
jgi:predicted nucleic-acid-binding protein